MWRERVLPRLERHLAQRLDSVASYQLLYHEAALANLLEVRHRGLVINCALVLVQLGAGWGLSSVPVELPALAAMPCVSRSQPCDRAVCTPAGAAVPQRRLRGCGGGSAH